MWQYNYNYPNYLAHYGVLGMKWGVRRYQNADGTLTAAGKAREKMLDARSEQNKHGYGTKAYNSAKLKAQYYSREFKDAKTKEALDNQKTKSKRQLALQEKYKKMGYTDSEAELKAYRHAKGETVALAAGGVAIAGLAAYVAYKHYDNTTNRIIKKASDLSRITTNANETYGDGRAMYAFQKKDRAQYAGLYANQLNFSSPGVYKVKYSVDSALKVASPKTAQNLIFNHLEADHSGRETLAKRLTQNAMNDPAPRKAVVYLKGAKDIANGKNTKAAYEAINMGMYDQDTRKYVAEILKTAGYDAVRDVNDHKYSGFNSKNPLIIVSPEKLGKVAVDKVGLVSAQNLATKWALVKNGKSLSAIGLGIGAIKANSKIQDEKSNNIFVNKYRKEHPNSKLSANEILKIKDREDAQ